MHLAIKKKTPGQGVQPGIVGAGGAALDNSQNVRSVLLMHLGNTLFDRAQGTIQRGLYVSMISGSFPGQDGAQLLGDGIADPYAGLVGAHMLAYKEFSATGSVYNNWNRLRLDGVDRLYVSSLVTGSVGIVGTPTVDTELPAAVTLGTDSIPHPVAPAVGSFLFASRDGATWSRPRIDGGIGISGTFSLRTSLYGMDPAASLLGASPVAVDAAGRVQTYTEVTGTVSVDSELPTPVALGDAVANPTVPQVGAHMMGWQPDEAEWARLRLVDYNDSLSISGRHYLAVNAALSAWNGSELSRMRGTTQRGLAVTMISGSFPGQATSTLLNDAVANPYAGLVGGLGMSYDLSVASWFRNPGDGWFAFQNQAPRITSTLQLPQVWAHGAMNALGTAVNYPLFADNRRRLMTTALVTGTVATESQAVQTILRAQINVSGTAGEFEVIPAVGGQQIKVLGMMLSARGTAVNARFMSGFTGTYLSGRLYGSADGNEYSISSPNANDEHYLETLSGDNLVLDLSGNMEWVDS